MWHLGVMHLEQQQNSEVDRPPYAALSLSAAAAGAAAGCIARAVGSHRRQ